MKLSQTLLFVALGACAQDATESDPTAPLDLSEGHTVEARSTYVAPDGSTHARVNQRYKGLPVIGGTASIHTDAAGAVTTTDGTIHELDIDVTPRISVEQARIAATASANASAELAILPIQEQVRVADPLPDGRDNAANFKRVTTGAKLVYRVTNGDIESLVDAVNGQVIRSASTSKDVTAQLHTFYSGTVTGTIQSDSGVYWMADPTRGNLYAWDPHESDGFWLSNTVPSFGDGQKYVSGSAHSETAAADAYFGGQIVYQMFHKVFGWKGVDDNGLAPPIEVHTPDTNNAHYLTNDTITIGDAPDAPGGTMASIDVVGHEFTHGVDRYTAGLGGNPEADGMNEGNSDIFGVLSHIYFAKANAFANGALTIPDTTSSDFNTLWIQGKDEATVVRSMFEPGIPYWTSSIVNAASHSALGPLDRMFFFLAQGSPADVTSARWSHGAPWGMDGLGNDRAGHLWFYALDLYLQSNATYMDAHDAAIQSARFLNAGVAFTSDEKAVRNAFAAVDVGDPAVNAPPAPDLLTVTTGHNTDASPYGVIISRTGPVANLKKLDLTASGHAKMDVIGVSLPCTQKLGARLEFSGATFALDAFDNGTHIASSSTIGNLVVTVPTRTCTGSRNVLLHVTPGSGSPKYTLRLDLHT
ncbi:MAG: M4 family metallopeptidase [Kofleriaceae bacterium]